MRDLVGMRLRPEEDALARLLPCHGLDSKDASEDFEDGRRRPACAKQGDNWMGETVSARQAPPERQSICVEELCRSCASSWNETDTSGGQTREPSLRRLE